MSKIRELNREELELLSANPELFKVNRIGKNPSKAGSKIKWTEEQINFIKQDYKNNLDVKRLSLLFKTSEQAMREWLHKFGIKTLTKTEKNRLKKVRNSDYFEIINTPDKAYWLGFLYADGGITSDLRNLRINLKEEDEQHLNKFLKAIEATTITVKHSIKKDKGKEYRGSYICIGDKKMISDLINKGCTPRKTETITFPTENQVPKELLNHFIRGYFDGDGCITWANHKNSELKYFGGCIIGTENLLKGILREFNKENLRMRKLSNRNDYIYVINFSGNRVMNNIGKYLYKDSNEDIELTRKKERFNMLFKQRQDIRTYSNKEEYIGIK